MNASGISASEWSIRTAEARDVADLMAMIRSLADYERLSHLVVADEAALAASLFGERPAAEVLIAHEAREFGAVAGFALFFPTFSTFLGRRGLWLEDLFVYPNFAGADSVASFWPRSQRWRGSGSADASSGRCSTGTSPRSRSISAWGRRSCRSGGLPA